MSDSYSRNRELFGSVSGAYRVLAADTGLITLAAAPLRSTIFVQKIHIEVTTGAGSELWTFQDGNGIPLVPSVSAAAVANFEFDFGPDGVPCAAATAFVLNVTGATGAIGWISWEAFQKIVPMVDYASLILALAPLGYWRFEESGGNVFADSSGNFHDFNGGGAGGPGQNLAGVRFRQPSDLHDGTFGIATNLPGGLGTFPITITASPSVVAPTGTLTVTWAGIPAGQQVATNWFTLTKVGRPIEQYVGWKYITATGAGSMSMPVNNNVGGTPEPGTYNLRLHYADGWNLLQVILGQIVISPTGPTSGLVSSASPVPLVLGTTCTIECRFALHGFNGASNYAFIVGDTALGLYLFRGAGPLYYVDLYYGGDHLSNAILLDTKYYLAVVCNAGAVTFYLNGVPAGTAAAWPGVTVVSLFNNFFAGVLGGVVDIDELVLYGTALSPAVVANHATFWT